MLQAADAAIVARDPDLPGLALALDAAAVSDLLGTAAEPVHLRYKPGTSCMATFRTADGFITLRALTRARFDANEFSPRRAALSRFLPDHAVIVMPPEADKRIPALRRGLCLQEALPLRYKPERRMVLRRNASMLKAMSKATWDRARIGADFGARHGGPAVRSVDETNLLIETEWLEGESAEAAPECYARIGAALAALHQGRANLPPLRPSRPPPALDDLEWLAPDLSEPIRRLRTSLDLLLHDAGCVPCHGDFSADQVMLSADNIAFVDWDEAGCGDPARDIASFLARMDHDRLLGSPSDATAFLAGYGPLPANLAAHHAAALAALATEGFRTRHPDWPDLARRLLHRAEEILPAADPITVAADPAAMARLSGHPITAAAIIRTKPGRRAVVRYDTADGPLIGKLRVKGADRRTPALHHRLRQAGLDGTGDTGVTAARAEIDALHLWMQDLAPGGLLTDLLEPEGPCEPFLATGRSLARLHLSGVQADRDWTMEQEVQVLRAAVAQSPEAGALCDALCAKASALKTGPSLGIHRDFYPDQVLVDGPRIWLLDLDLYANGDPAIDLGNMLAHLDELAIRRGWEPAALAPQAEAFLAGYASLRAVPPHVQLMRWISLARHIGIARRFPDRTHTPPAILAHILCNL